MLYDCHTHTIHSDGKNSTAEICASAIKKGVGGITVTDHANMNFYMERDTYKKINESIKSAEEAKEKFGGQLNILTGVELGEYTIAPKKAEEILSLDCFDAILCSVHFVPQAGWSLAYNRIDFQNNMTTNEEINEYLDLYLDLLSETVDAFDFDILAHIHCPVRYISGKWGRKSNIMLFEEKIARILQKIIKRDIALELNTARLFDERGSCNFHLDEILTLYRKLGGRMVTLGSDAHSKEGIANNFSSAALLLKKCGFNSIFYFEKRKAKEIII